MKHKTPGVTDELLLVAKKEFLSQGFQKASLRNIATKANVSTNSIYNRFTDKAGLFDAIVGTSANELRQLINTCSAKVEEGLSFDATASFSGDATFETLDYIYEHFDEFKLIFCKSSGTKYENFIDELSESEELVTKNFIKGLGLEGKVSELFIHTTTQAGYIGLMETVAHNLSKEEAVSFMKEFFEYRMAGWKAVLGQ